MKKFFNKAISTYVLCIICICFYLMECIVSKSFIINNVTLFEFGALLTPCRLSLKSKILELPRIFFAMFVHLTPLHIISNMAFLLIIGTYIEPIFGHIRFLLIYLTSGIVGDISALCFSKPYSLIAGASTALFGILMAGIMVPYLLHNQHLKYFSKQMFGLLIANIIIDLFTPSISLIGHLGGVCGGIIFGFLLRPKILDKKFTYLGLELLLSLLVLAIIIFIYFILV